MGLEPTTPCLQSRCSSQLSYVPEWGLVQDSGRSPRLGQSSLSATAFGVTFIFGSYSATSTTRPSRRNATRSWDRQSSHGP